MLKFILNKEIAETFSYWATALGILLALLGAAGAYVRYRADRRLRQWESARDAYVSFMDLAIAHPEFHPGYWASAADPISKNKFVWFIARFLWAAEEILTYAPDDLKVWMTSIKGVIQEHRDFFLSESGEAETACYRPSMIKLIRQAVVQPLPQCGALDEHPSIDAK